MTTRRAITTILCCLLASGCAAERAPLPGDSVAADGAVALDPGRVPIAPVRTPLPEAPSPLEAALFTPEIVMANQNAIGLTPTQRESIAKEVEKTHTELLRTQWDLDKAKEKLVTVLGNEHIDEARSKEASAELMKHEIAIKTGHLAMLVRVKNTLTKDQQTKLRAVRDGQRCGARSDGGGP